MIEGIPDIYPAIDRTANDTSSEGLANHIRKGKPAHGPRNEGEVHSGGLGTYDIFFSKANTNGLLAHFISRFTGQGHAESYVYIKSIPQLAITRPLIFIPPPDFHVHDKRAALQTQPLCVVFGSGLVDSPRESV